MDGIVNINKPAGITSFKVVSFMRNLTKIKKIGHAGTLDPCARGVLLVCLGKACKSSSKLMNMAKVYETDITFGITTDSGDVDGKILSKKPVVLTREDLEKTVKSFIGEIEQVPPMVSAVHHKGRRLYELARKGITVERTPRKVKIHDIKILDFKDDSYPTATMVVSCSKGTYIRTLCEDIGKSLGIGAYESRLIRLKSGKYDISSSKTLDEIENLYNSGRLSEAVINEY